MKTTNTVSLTNNGRAVVIISKGELAELRAKAARCDTYERDGEALIEDDMAAGFLLSDFRAACDPNGYEAGVRAVARRVVARCRARVDKRLRVWEERSRIEADPTTAHYVNAVATAVRKAMQ